MYTPQYFAHSQVFVHLCVCVCVDQMSVGQSVFDQETWDQKYQNGFIWKEIWMKINKRIHEKRRERKLILI